VFRLFSPCIIYWRYFEQITVAPRLRPLANGHPFLLHEPLLALRAPCTSSLSQWTLISAMADYRLTIAKAVSTLDPNTEKATSASV
jgi:hypothetical protein